MDLNFMIRLYRQINFWFKVLKSYGRGLLQIQKIIFDSPVQSKINLLFMLISDLKAGFYVFEKHLCDNQIEIFLRM